MSYNTDPRKPLTKKRRAQFLIDHLHTCYWCDGIITDDKWDVEHKTAREMLPPGAGADDPANLAPIHRDPCHREKTAMDRRLIAKSNRIRRENGPPELRRKTKPIQSRGFGEQSRPVPSRPFQSKRTT